MSSVIVRISAVLLVIASSNTALAEDCYVIGDTSKNNSSQPQGSARNPYGSLAAVQADLGCDTIFVLHSELVLDGGISLRDGQELVGKTGPGRDLPVISNTNGLNGGNGVQLAANNSIDSLHIDGTQNSGVFGTDVGSLEILNSQITNFALSGNIVQLPAPLAFISVSRAGIEISPSQDAKIRIAETELGDADSMSIAILPLAEHTDIVIENVSIRDTGITPGAGVTPGIAVAGFGFSSVDLKVRNTSVSNIGADSCNCDGMGLLASGSSTMDVLVDGYRYSNPDGDGGGSATGIEAGNYFASGARFKGAFKNNVIESPSSVGIQILDQAPGSNNQLNVQIRDNEIYGAGNGIDLDIGFGASHGTNVVTIENNLIANPVNHGIQFVNAIGHQDLVHLLIRRNTVMNASIGLYFEQAVGGSVGSLILDAGLGGLGSEGHNRIVGSHDADVYVGTFDCCGFPLTPPFSADAADNWWGSSSGPDAVVELGGASVDVTPFLTEDPAED